MDDPGAPELPRTVRSKGQTVGEVGSTTPSWRHRRRTKLPPGVEEQKRLLEVAARFFDDQDAMGTRIGPGARSSIPSRRIWETVFMMATAGLHRVVINDPVGHMLEVTTEGELRWLRPKKFGSDAITVLPLPDLARGWAADWTSWLRGRGGIKRTTLTAILHRIGDRAGVAGGVTQMSLRHTAGYNLARRGVPAPWIQNILNCGPRAARTYTRLAPKAMEMDLRRLGALKGPGEE